MYYCAFTIDRMGYACSIATIMTLLMLVATVAYLRFGRRGLEEAG
ncbi:MAG: sugar ABC transporter permease [Armatimonadetes bacterium]|nr:sugar ABC transporter permease [Armatimonadota bacterium]